MKRRSVPAISTGRGELLIQFTEALLHYYGASDATLPAMAGRYRRFTNPWATTSGAYIFVLKSGRVRFGSSVTGSTYMSDTLVSRIAGRVMPQAGTPGASAPEEPVRSRYVA